MNLTRFLPLLLVGGLVGCSGGTQETITTAESKQIQGGPRPANVDVGAQIANSKAAWQAKHGGAAGAGTTGTSGTAPAPGASPATGK